MLVAGGFGVVALVAGFLQSVGAAFLAVGLAIAGSDLCRGAQDSSPPQPAAARMPSGGGHRPQAGLFSYGGGAVVPLDQVRFARKLQIGSSSPKLVAVTPGGTHVLKRGNPFDGGVGNVDELLSAVVRGG